MRPDHRGTDLLEIEHPNLQAPMLGRCAPAFWLYGQSGALNRAMPAAEFMDHPVSETRRPGRWLRFG